MAKERLFYDIISSGEMSVEIVSDEKDNVVYVSLSGDSKSTFPHAIPRRSRWHDDFKGFISCHVDDLSHIPIDFGFFSHSQFQRKVWEACRTISYSETMTYSGFSERFSLGSPRAVGNALARNPLPLLVPCHRIISKRGIGGFMGVRDGKEITMKKMLLELETPKNI